MQYISVQVSVNKVKDDNLHLVLSNKSKSSREADGDAPTDTPACTAFELKNKQTHKMTVACYAQKCA